MRGEKIDIIEWSDEPSVFAANALSPAKVSQVRITDINNRKMEVIVSEDQLSLAIGKRGQNVRLATRLVGWDIDIISEDLLKKEIAQKMGKMMAAGEAVPITALEGVSVTQADSLREKGIEDVEKFATTSVDELVDILDVSLDSAESIIKAAKEVVSAKAENAQATEESSAEETLEEVEAPAESEASEIEVEEQIDSVEVAEIEKATETVEEAAKVEKPVKEKKAKKAKDESKAADAVETESEIASDEAQETE